MLAYFQLWCISYKLFSVIWYLRTIAISLAQKLLWYNFTDDLAKFYTTLNLFIKKNHKNILSAGNTIQRDTWIYSMESFSLHAAEHTWYVRKTIYFFQTWLLNMSFTWFSREFNKDLHMSRLKTNMLNWQWIRSWNMIALFNDIPHPAKKYRFTTFFDPWQISAKKLWTYILVL